MSELGEDATCAHFTGARSTCRAGRSVETYRDSELRLACRRIRGIQGAISCDAFTTQPPKRSGEVSALLRGLERAADGSCPVCGDPVTSERTVGEGVFASPCGHKLRSAPRAPRTRPDAD